MDDIRPFRGLYYDPKVAGYLDRLLAPPPDRISAEAAMAFGNRSPHNVLHLLQGESVAGDTMDQNRYTRARSQLLEWTRAGVLRREPEPMFYLYEQEHGPHMRYALVALARLPAAGAAPATTRTQPSPEDKLVAACHTNLCLVPTLWEDADTALWDVLDRMHYDADDQRCEVRDGAVLHRFKSVHGAHYASLVTAATAGRQGRVVGGQADRERWEAAIRYRDYARRESPEVDERSPESYALVALLSAKDPGLGKTEPELEPPFLAGLVMNRIDGETLGGR